MIGRSQILFGNPIFKTHLGVSAEFKIWVSNLASNWVPTTQMGDGSGFQIGSGIPKGLEWGNPEWVPLEFGNSKLVSETPNINGFKWEPCAGGLQVQGAAAKLTSGTVSGFCSSDEHHPLTSVRKTKFPKTVFIKSTESTDQ